jgi:ADP-ribose pyrophosphatase YjhB (NUDIX family)
MKYCSLCGHKVVLRVPEDDHRMRSVCTHCDHIHYENPRVITGTLPVWEGKILLCKRGIEPRLGYWTLPGGFLENGESLVDGALRETEEEACAQVIPTQLISIISLPTVNQIHCFHLADMVSPAFATTPESTEIALVALEDIPWDDIAFKTVKKTLEHYCAFYDQDRIPLLETSITPPPRPAVA